VSRIPLALPASSVEGWTLLLQGVLIAAYALAQLLAVAYSAHRYAVLWRWARDRRRLPAPLAPLAPPPADCWPVVTVQLPIYNEPRVVERLLRAVAALDYPRGRLEIQVLDDSTDDTSARAARLVARHRRLGCDIRHLRRPDRGGFKAGALAAGLRAARGELIAVFDADFVPPPDFLRRLVPRFEDPAIGMVQARWEHLNRTRSSLTRAQAVMLDAHFLVEHVARAAGSLFFNFNGTAGIWRRACLEDAGGWSADTLTEDLDLSYRAQLRGWRFAFESGVLAPAELPTDVAALKSQQRRWAKGSIQTARKLLLAVLAAPLPARVKLESVFHLTANAAYALPLALGLLLLPVLLATGPGASWAVAVVQVGVLLFGMVPALLFLALGQRAAGRRGLPVARDVAAAVLLAVGLSLNNARAVVEGLGRAVGPWERTPKTGDPGGRRRPRAPAGRDGPSALLEALLALCFAVLAWGAWRAGHAHAVPLLGLLLAGFGGLAWAARSRTAGVRPGRGLARFALLERVGVRTPSRRPGVVAGSRR
jgi:cellulose synthase/poly-beta-1,6-N-acetylglucosamine synthase-like glycosyltransferase